MIRRLLFAIICLSVTHGYAQEAAYADTLTAGVFHSPNDGMVLHGATRDLSHLDIRTHALTAGHSFSFPNDKADHLLIVREGSIGDRSQYPWPGWHSAFPGRR